MNQWKRIIKNNIMISLASLPLFAYNNCGSPGFETVSVSEDLASTAGDPSLPNQPSTPTTTLPPVTQPPNPPTGNKVEIFVASGHQGRTIMSCDEGQTWINDRSDNPNAICWGPDNTDPNYAECDHSPSAGTGIEYANGYFYTTFGWGYGGTVRRSSDGANWQVLKSGGWGGGLAIVQNSLMLLWDKWPITHDWGSTWTNTWNTTQLSGFNARRLTKAGNKLIAMGGTTGIAISSDLGVNWSRPASFQPAWGDGVEKGRGGAVEGNGVIVILSTKTASPNILYASRSTDQGQTWTAVEVATGSGFSWSSLIFANGKFMSWGGGKMWTSTDGASWTGTAMNIGNVPGPIARNSKGVFTLIKAVWANYYNLQYAYRSTDGVNWTKLSATAFPGGHPLNFILSGEVDASACP